MATPTARFSTFRQAYRDERRVAVARPARTPLTVRAARILARRLPHWATIRTATLSISGFGLITAAAWHLHTVAGLTAAGVSLLILEALTGGERQ